MVRSELRGRHRQQEHSAGSVFFLLVWAVFLSLHKKAKVTDLRSSNDKSAPYLPTSVWRATTLNPN